jgi:hypothetical protein
MRCSPPCARIAAFAALAIALAYVGPAHAAAAKPLTVKPWMYASNPPNQILAPPANDKCSGAIVLGCGTFNLSGTTAEANNDYTFLNDSLSCTTFTEDGRDVVYRINAVAGDSLWVDLYSPDGLDVAVYLLQSPCPTAPNTFVTTCVAGEDSVENGVVPETLRWKFLVTGTYYMVFDGIAPDVGGTFIATGQLRCIITPPPPSNDRCNAAIPLTCGTLALSGSTEFAFDDYRFTSASNCMGSGLAQGKDVVFLVQAHPGDSLWLDYQSTGDGAAYLVADCADVQNTCFYGKNTTGANGVEQIRYRFNFGGNYFLILDTNGSNTFGTWTANGGLACAQPPVNDICEYALPLHCGLFQKSGSTELAFDHYEFDSLPCTGYQAAGKDVVYKIYAHAGDSLWAYYTTTTDGSVYILRDCNNPEFACVAGYDEVPIGEPEFMHYKFTQSGWHYIILDSFGFNTYGTWTFTGELKCPTIDVDDPGGGPRSLAIASIAPNPFSREATVTFTLPMRARTTLRIVDLQGRVVRNLVDNTLDPGPHSAVWDGLSDEGRPVEPGVYFAKLSDGRSSVVRRSVFVK